MTAKRFASPWVFVLLLLTHPLAAQEASGGDLTARLDAMLAGIYRPDEPGAAVIAVKDGAVVFRKGYGSANLELGVPIRPEMVFRLGSVTKQFTATAILMLAEQGKLSTSDPITKYLPDYPTHGQRITIEHLLTHTSGVKNYTDLPAWLSRMREDLSVSQMIELFENEPPDFAPGEKWSYSNSGYFLLGAVIEKVSGKSYADFIEQDIFRPLGMAHSFYGSNAPIIKDRVSGYEKRDGRWVNADFLSMTQPYAAGALLSSVDDLAVWDAAIVGEKLLSKKSLETMFTPKKLASGESTDYGYGWAIRRYDGHRLVEHGGGIHGFLSNVVRLPDDRAYVALLTNDTSPEEPPSFVSMKIVAALLGKPIEDPVAVRLDTAALDACAGVYDADDGSSCTVTREGDRLFLQTSGGPKLEIFPASETRFFLKHSLKRLLFMHDAAGKVERLEISGGDGPTQIAKRTDRQPAPPRKAVALDPRLLDSFVGRYELAPSFVITITREGDGLMAQATGREKLPLCAESETSFFVTEVDAQVSFERGANGAVTGLVLHQGGRDASAKRLP